MTTMGTSSVPCLASGSSRGHSGDVLAIVAPGQGAQKPGFLSDWMSDATFSDHLAWLSAVADIDLVTHGTTSDEATIKDTAVAQPLLRATQGGQRKWRLTSNPTGILVSGPLGPEQQLQAHPHCAPLKSRTRDREPTKYPW